MNLYEAIIESRKKNPRVKVSGREPSPPITDCLGTIIFEEVRPRNAL